MWFDVDKVGLGKLLNRKGKKFVLFELIQNAWDQNVTRVDITLTKDPGSRYATISIEDDAPDGFRDLSHAWTLFAESDKKGDVRKRGRFNLGEKLAISICEKAEIFSTTGGVRFDAEGRHRLRMKRERGSVFTGLLKMTNEEMAECVAAIDTLISPAETEGIVTTFNGRVLARRVPLVSFDASLRTEIADCEGNLKTCTRKTEVMVYEPQPGEIATLYELGIPVVETGDTYHLDVQQKLPLNFDRDNVPPGYLRSLRPLVLNAVYQHLPEAEVSAGWVQEALGESSLSEDAVCSVVDSMFGPKTVVYDPSDPEANKLAVAAGYHVVAGRQFSKKAWEMIRKASALRPAGQVTPSPKPFHPDGRPLEIIPPDKWTDQETIILTRFKEIARILIGVDITVKLANAPMWKVCGCFCKEIRELIVNKAKYGSGFWDSINETNLNLLIHELGHYYEGDHLSYGYHNALTNLGAKLAIAVATEPCLVQ
jgi:hypothetical protein